MWGRFLVWLSRLFAEPPVACAGCGKAIPAGRLCDSCRAEGTI